MFNTKSIKVIKRELGARKARVRFAEGLDFASRIKSGVAHILRLNQILVGVGVVLAAHSVLA